MIKERDRGHPILISLCMIVKDEAKVLARCLSSVRDYVDEIVVVDTGSTDDTIEIVKAYGGKVFSHPWDHDFSKHRNQSLGYARGEWIFILDADEVLKNYDRECLSMLCKDHQADAFYFSVINVFNGGASRAIKSQIRLFRNSREIGYKGIVHNQLFGYKEPKFCSGLIYHDGYDLSAEKRTKKFSRTKNLLLSQIDNDPNNYWHRHNLAVAYSSNFMFEEAEREGRQAIRLAESQDGRNPNLAWACYIVAMSNFKLEDLDSAEHFALKGLKVFKRHLDSCFVLILVYHSRKDWQKLFYYGRKFLKGIDRLKSGRLPQEIGGIVHTLDEGWRVRVALGEYYLAERSLNEAKDEFKAALAECPLRNECLRRIGDCYRKYGNFEPGYVYYGNALEGNPNDIGALLGRAACAKKLRKNGDAMKIYKSVLKLDPQSVTAMVSLGDFHYELEEYDKAANYYEKVKTVEPMFIKAYLRLAKIHAEKNDYGVCQRYYIDISNRLGLSCRQVPTEASELANSFLVLAFELGKVSQGDLLMEAAEVAVAIQPELIFRELMPEVGHEG